MNANKKSANPIPPLSLHSIELQRERDQQQAGHMRQGSGSGGLTLGGVSLAHVTHPSQLTEAQRRELANMRVVQRNLVYLVGLAPSIAKEETLRSNSFFGQYGKIVKVAVARGDDGGKLTNL